jgi:hypothetical protein
MREAHDVVRKLIQAEGMAVFGDHYRFVLEQAWDLEAADVERVIKRWKVTYVSSATVFLSLQSDVGEQPRRRVCSRWEIPSIPWTGPAIWWSARATQGVSTASRCRSVRPTCASPERT